MIPKAAPSPPSPPSPWAQARVGDPLSARHSDHDPGQVRHFQVQHALPDAVLFTAPCPACGQNCDWTERREETRSRAVVSCDCGGDPR